MRRKETVARGKESAVAFQNSNDSNIQQARKSAREVYCEVPRRSGQIKRFPTPLSEFDLARLYEKRKSAWTSEHAAASPSEYEAAMRRICDELGY